MIPTVKKVLKYAKYVLALVVATLFAPFSANDDGSSVIDRPIVPGFPVAEADSPPWTGGDGTDDC